MLHIYCEYHIAGLWGCRCQCFALHLWCVEWACRQREVPARCRSADGLVCSEVFEGEGRLEEGEQLSGPKKATSRYVVLEWIELIPN